MSFFYQHFALMVRFLFMGKGMHVFPQSKLFINDDVIRTEYD